MKKIWHMAVISTEIWFGMKYFCESYCAEKKAKILFYSAFFGALFSVLIFGETPETHPFWLRQKKKVEFYSCYCSSNPISLLDRNSQTFLKLRSRFSSHSFAFHSFLNLLNKLVGATCTYKHLNVRRLKKKCQTGQITFWRCSLKCPLFDQNKGNWWKTQRKVILVNLFTPMAISFRFSHQLKLCSTYSISFRNRSISLIQNWSKPFGNQRWWFFIGPRCIWGPIYHCQTCNQFK